MTDWMPQALAVALSFCHLLGLDAQKKLSAHNETGRRALSCNAFRSAYIVLPNVSNGSKVPVHD